MKYFSFKFFLIFVISLAYQTQAHVHEVHTYTSQLPHWNLRNQRVIVRADLNIPLDRGTILDDAKLTILRPTLDYLCEQQCVITLITHIDQPKSYDPLLSTRVLLPWFTQRGYNVVHAESVEKAHTLSHNIAGGSIIMLDNIRFFDGETNNSTSLAHQLKQCGDWYINDAFASLHRAHASLSALPVLFDTEHKTVGFNTAHELQALHAIVSTIQHPFVLIIGGKKIESKLPYLRAMLSKADAMVLCPAVTFTALHTQGIPTGKSFVEKSIADSCSDFLAEAQNNNVTLVYPEDIQVSYGSFDGPYSVVATTNMPADAIGISIGPKSVAALAPLIHNAGTILSNGPMGFLEKPDTLAGMHSLMQHVANSPAQTIVAGGDSVAVLRYFGLEQQITHATTAGGAALAYISGQILPALEALKI